MSTAEVTSKTTSSEVKGESPLDSVHTFAMYHDLIVIRSPDAGFSEQCALLFAENDVHSHIINGGAAMEQHPTQALLDVYTLSREFSRRGGIDGKRILLVGDLARGRAVRSLIYLLGKYRGISIDLAAPTELRLGDDMKDYMHRRGIEFRESQNVDQFISEADAVYMTRIQDEYDLELPAGNVDYTSFCLSKHSLTLLKTNAVVLHPLPRRAEIPLFVDHDPRSRYWEQVENGMWARVALIAQMFDCELRIKSA